jgi:hypothetical protein
MRDSTESSAESYETNTSASSRARFALNFKIADDEYLIMLPEQLDNIFLVIGMKVLIGTLCSDIVTLPKCIRIATKQVNTLIRRAVCCRNKQDLYLNESKLIA